MGTVHALARRWRVEILIVLGLSLGKSAIYAVVNLVENLSRAPISQATAQLNTPRINREYFDLTYQLLDNFFALVPVALAIYLLWRPHRSGFRAIGFNFSKPGRDALWGIGLMVLIGLPSLGLYALGRSLGITAQIVTNSLNDYWWTIPVLVISALRNAIVEEVIVVGFLLTRFKQLGWQPWLAIVVSSLLRGSYHLYQGFGPFVGNFVMGLIFGWLYTRTKRVMPLVIAHALLDIAAFSFGRQLGFG
ncbi:CPBP family intramembrane glutamic endopeptidase [Psychromicrobium lacuslunae]|uniref:CAAX protease n=1 Tax=Psychromicrobium lacuslunae TaxID=1618207 RepID=A0A0D4BYR6_9MICC|nr:CPBP family intramembrane glutamic endopeptidase [Psychromicrobium lacuslunae]AJT41469.1 CAAX protease [Psychromicrobium lacuslunae]